MISSTEFVVEGCQGKVTGDNTGCSVSCADGYLVNTGTEGAQTCDANAGQDTSSFKNGGVALHCEGV